MLLNYIGGATNRSVMDVSAAAVVGRVAGPAAGRGLVALMGRRQQRCKSPFAPLFGRPYVLNSLYALAHDLRLHMTEPCTLQCTD